MFHHFLCNFFWRSDIPVPIHSKVSCYILGSILGSDHIFEFFSTIEFFYDICFNWGVVFIAVETNIDSRVNCSLPEYVIDFTEFKVSKIMKVHKLVIFEDPFTMLYWYNYINGYITWNNRMRCRKAIFFPIFSMKQIFCLIIVKKPSWTITTIINAKKS